MAQRRRGYNGLYVVLSDVLTPLDPTSIPVERREAYGASGYATWAWSARHQPWNGVASLEDDRRIDTV